MTASDGQGGGEGGPEKSDQVKTDQSGGGAQAEAPALTVIEAFGGIRPMAKQLGLAVSTVQGWKERSAIPANRHDQIRASARKHGIDIDAEVLRASAPVEGAPGQPPVIEGEATPLAGAAPGDAKKESDKGADNKGADNKGAEKPSGPGPMSAASAATKPRPGAEPGKPAPSKAKPSKEAATPPASAKPSRGSAFLPGLVLGILLAVAVAAGTIYTRSYWSPLVGEAASPQGETGAAVLAEVDARLAALQAKLPAEMPADNSAALSSLSERLSTLEAALSQGAGQDPGTRAALDSVSAQLARMTDRIAALEQELEAELASLRSIAGAPSAEITSRLGSEAARLNAMLQTQSELATRLTAAEEGLNAAATSREAAPGSRETLMLLAMLQLRDALQGSGPYDQPLRMLQNLAGDDPALAKTIATLQRRASVGLPSLRDLQAAFPDVARRLAAIEIGEEGEGWSAGVLRRLSAAVNLRPVGLVEGDALTAVAARAEVKLNDGDLAGALAEIDSLEGAAAEAAASWRADAELRLAANRALGDFGAQVSERFATMSGG